MTDSRLCFLVFCLSCAGVQTVYGVDPVESTIVAYGFNVQASASGGSGPAVNGHDSDSYSDIGSGKLSVESGVIDAPVTKAPAFPSFANASGSATAKADFGALGVSFEGVADVDIAGSSSFDGFVEASWLDTVTFDSPRFTSPHSVIITVPLRLDGNMGIIPGPNGGGRIDFILRDEGVHTLPPAPIGHNVFLGTDQDTWGLAINDTNNDPPSSIPCTIQCNTGVPFTLGYLMEIKVSGSSAAGTTFGNTMVLNADFGNTLTWGGITTVQDAITGEVIDDWTIESVSGFDYSQPFPVPEPSSFVLFAIAVALFTVTPPTRTVPRPCT
ncbi:MAG: hypothetical protein R3C10_23915 [Pirellulales bacterium]